MSILSNVKVQQKKYIFYLEYELEKANKSFEWNEKYTLLVFNPYRSIVYRKSILRLTGYLKLSSPPTVLGGCGGEDTVMQGQVSGFFHRWVQASLDSVLHVLVGHDLLQGGDDGRQDFLDERLVNRDNFKAIESKFQLYRTL